MNKKTLLTAISVVLVLAMVVGGTLAYLQGVTEEVVNDFEQQFVSIDLSETGLNDQGQNTNFKVIPGFTQTKDPKITVTANIPSYVFLKVDDKSTDYILWELNDGWEELENGVYYREVEGQAAAYNFELIKNNKVTYSTAITSGDQVANASLSFTAYVIQKMAGGNMDANGNITSISTFTPAQAWAVVNGDSAAAAAAAAEAISTATSSKVTAVAEEPTVLTVTAAPSETTNLTTVTVPADAFAPEEGVQPTLQIKVDTTNEMISVTSSEGTAATIDVSLLVNDVVTTSNNNTLSEGKYYTVETYIAKGLHEVTLAYGDETWNKVNEITDAKQFTYDAETGKLVFTTTHFSEFVVKSTDVAYNVNKDTAYTDLQGAINVASVGDTVNLLADVTRVEVGGTQTVSETDIRSFGIWIDKNLTLDGKGHTLTSNLSGLRSVVGITGEYVTLMNITVNTDSQCGLAVETRANVKTLNLDNCVISTEAFAGSYSQPLTIGGSNYSPTVNISNSVIKTRDAATQYYAIIIWNPTNLNISNTDIFGWANLYFKEGSAGSKATVNGGTMKSVGLEGDSNTFAVLAFEDSNIDVVVNDADITVSTGAEISRQLLAMFSDWYGPNNNNSVTINGGSISFAGGNARFVLDSGTEGNMIAVNNAKINGVENQSYSYHTRKMSSVSNNAWYSNGPFTTSAAANATQNYIFEKPFLGGWFEDGEGMVMTNDVTIDGDILLDMNNGSIYFYFNEHTLAGGRILLNDGVSIISDTSTKADCFKPVDDSRVIIVEPIEGGYRYSAELVISGGGESMEEG